MIQPIDIVQNDYGYEIPFTLQDGNGDPLDLTGAVLTLEVQASQDPNVELLFTGTMAIDDAVSGTCHYVVASTDFENPGTCLAQIVVTYTGERLSYSGIQINVLPALPKSLN